MQHITKLPEMYQEVALQFIRKINPSLYELALLVKDDELQEVRDWREENGIKACILKRTGLVLTDCGHFTVDDLKGDLDHLSVRSKGMIERITPKKLSNWGNYAYVGSEDDAMAIKLRWC